ncbi:MAG: hypothetical protein M3R38_02280 [Actinomycetota bacterium]|nr:hypothetical protein [Actinomycetota bacterium]MDP9485209.1 hypothetical protein [Actinomycetota bacterium]
MKRSERRAAFTGLVGGSVDLDTFKANLQGNEAPAAQPESNGTPENERAAPHPSRTPLLAKPERDDSRTQRTARPGPSGDARTDPGEEGPAPCDRRTVVDRRELLDAVYGALLEEPTEENLRFWDALGVSEQTVREGRFGSVPMHRSKAIVQDLAERFGAEALLSIPGFESTGAGRLVFTLVGAAPVVPYRDGDGLITALVSFRVPDDPDASGPRPVHPKAPEDHLYVHPRYDPSRIVAVCESPLQAILAAEAGFAVGAIAGPGRHRVPKVGATLPELEGIDFEGKRVLYVPSLGAGEDAQRSMTASLAAAEALIARHGGTPVVAPQDFPGGFGRWLLARPEAVREPDLSELVEDADPHEDLEARVLNPAERAKRKAPRNEARTARRGRTKKSQDQDRGRGEDGEAAIADQPTFVRPPTPMPLPSKALITSGEAFLSFLGALVAFWLFGRVAAAFPEATAGYLSSMPSWADAPFEAALIIAGFAALWVWSQRSSIRRKRRRLRQGRIDH